MDLEEITVYEINRIGMKMSKDFELLLKSSSDKGVSDSAPIISTYRKMLEGFNTLVSESNSYLGDHIVKYYRDRSSGGISYRATKKNPMGYIR